MFFRVVFLARSFRTAKELDRLTYSVLPLALHVGRSPLLSWPLWMEKPTLSARCAESSGQTAFGLLLRRRMSVLNRSLGLR